MSIDRKEKGNDDSYAAGDIRDFAIYTGKREKPKKETNSSTGFRESCMGVVQGMQKSDDKMRDSAA
jgi:hypothetical protein